jgi:hypothetical protein
MKRTFSLILAISMALITGFATGCSRSPVGPDPFGDSGGSARAGYALTLLSIEPRPMSTIDSRQGPALARVEAEYEQPPGALSNRLWVCLARDSSTFLYSSCRNAPLIALKGQAKGFTGIYYVNAAPAVADTRFILAFLVWGDLVVERRLYEDEIGLNRLSSRVFASRRVEHVLYWR